MINANDITFYDLGRCIVVKEFSFSTNHMGDVPVVPPIPRVGETVFLDDMAYKVEKVLHDWCERNGEFIGVITTVHVRQEP